MDNIFYAAPEDFKEEDWVEITGQEAQHITKVLRHKVGDHIDVANGLGAIYTCEIVEISKRAVRAKCGVALKKEEPTVKKAMAFGAIKKRDRFEFAIEKAVELGAWELCVFNSDHAERSKFNEERVRSIILSAFKQSGRYWLPEVVFKDSIDEVYNHYHDFKPIMAHEKEHFTSTPTELKNKHYLLLVGPEGGFSDREVELNKKQGGELISLGYNRLRAETAVAAFLSQYLFTD